MESYRNSLFYAQGTILHYSQSNHIKSTQLSTRLKYNCHFLKIMLQTLTIVFLCLENPDLKDRITI